jgi:hypothetical protein
MIRCVGRTLLSAIRLANPSERWRDPSHPFSDVILSGGQISRSGIRAKSKDPYTLGGF